jgi:hypothetical protein
LSLRRSQKSGSAISAARDGAPSHNGALSHGQAGLPSVWHQPDLLPLQTQPDAKNDVIADWLVRLTNNLRNWGFDLCFLYLRNVESFKWNHKRVYKIYRGLELNLRIKPLSPGARKAAAVGSACGH